MVRASGASSSNTSTGSSSCASAPADQWTSSAGAAKNKRAGPKKPSNIGKNQNPVLVLSLADQKAAMSNHYLTNQKNAANNSSSSINNFKNYVEKSEKSFSSSKHSSHGASKKSPESVAVKVSTSIDPKISVNVSEADGEKTLKFGSIEKPVSSRFPSIDYSKIASMHAAKNVQSATNTTSDSQNAEKAKPTEAKSVLAIDTEESTLGNSMSNYKQPKITAQPVDNVSEESSILDASKNIHKPELLLNPNSSFIPASNAFAPMQTHSLPPQNILPNMMHMNVPQLNQMGQPLLPQSVAVNQTDLAAGSASQEKNNGADVYAGQNFSNQNNAKLQGMPISSQIPQFYPMQQPYYPTNHHMPRYGPVSTPMGYPMFPGNSYMSHPGNFIPSGHPNAYANPGMYPMQQHNGAFIPQNSFGGIPPTGPPMASIPVPPVAAPKPASLLAPRKKNILQIIDPETGKSCFEDTESEKPVENVALVPSLKEVDDTLAAVPKDSSSCLCSSDIDVNIIMESQEHKAATDVVESQVSDSCITKIKSETADESKVEVESSESVVLCASEDSMTESDIDDDLDAIVILADNTDISYPEGIFPSIIRHDHRKVYSIEFLKRFEDLCNLLPEDSEEGSEFLTKYTGPMTANYLSGASRGFSSGKRHRESFSGSIRDRFDSLSGRSKSSGDVSDRNSRSRRSGGRKSNSYGGGSHGQPNYAADGFSGSHVMMPSSDNAWSKVARSKEELGGDEQVKRKFIGILNKLSTENFKDLYEKIKELNFSNLSVYSEVITKIYDKAVDESNFAEMYARLVQLLSDDFKTFPDVDPDIVQKTGSVTRALLLGRCQKEYNRRNVWATEDYEALKAEVEIPDVVPIDKPDDMTVEAYWRAKLRKRSLGNIKFVGELFKLGVISDHVIISCVGSLIDKETQEAEEMECLAKLLTTTGQQLDVGPRKQLFNSIFEKIKSISQLKSLSSRIRFMLMDLIELRAHDWKSKSQKDKEPVSSTSRSHSSEYNLKDHHSRHSESSGSINDFSNRRNVSKPFLKENRSQDKDRFYSNQSRPFSNANMQNSNFQTSEKQSGFSSSPVLSRSKPQVMTHSQSKYSCLLQDPAEDSTLHSSADQVAESATSLLAQSPKSYEVFDEEELRRKLDGLFKEYIHSKDVEEFIETIKEWKFDPSKLLSFVICSVVEKAVECNKKVECELLSNLLAEIKNNSTFDFLSEADFLESFKKAFEFVEDVAIDVPAAPSNVLILVKTLAEKLGFFHGSIEEASNTLLNHTSDEFRVSVSSAM